MRRHQKILITLSVAIGLCLVGTVWMTAVFPLTTSAAQYFPTIDPGAGPSSGPGWWPIVPCGQANNPCSLCHLWQMASNLINFVIFALSIPAAVLLFVVAGVILMTAGGDESKVAKTKDIFTKTIIGLVIIFCSWLIVDTLVKTVVNPSTEAGQVIWAWNEFPSCH